MERKCLGISCTPYDGNCLGRSVTPAINLEWRRDCCSVEVRVNVTTFLPPPSLPPPTLSLSSLPLLSRLTHTCIYMYSLPPKDVAISVIPSASPS